MIAAAGRQAYLRGRVATWDLEATPELSLPARGEPSNNEKPKSRRRSTARG